MTEEENDQDERKDTLALIWVHGFKGNEVTFEDFPPRIVRILEETHPSLRVQSLVFPAYETRGELGAASENFVEWLATKVVELENNAGRGGGAGSAKVVLMGHSMGGLLIADATARIAANTRQDDPLWPNVVGTIAFDTPYLGLHPHVFKHKLSEAASHVETARNVASNLAMLSPLAIGFGFGKAKQAKEETDEKSRSAKPEASGSWWSSTSKTTTTATTTETDAVAAAGTWWSSRTAVGISALALGAAAAGTAYYRRDDLATGWKWGFDHMTFVRNLWDNEGLKNRLDRIDELSRTRKILFANYFTEIPPKDVHGSRTFAILPSREHPLRTRWIPARNTQAKDEVEAHMGMFNPRTNDGFYDLGLAVVRKIADRVEEEGVRAGSITADEEKQLLVAEEEDLVVL